jgi:hypothetical protein
LNVHKVVKAGEAALKAFELSVDTRIAGVRLARVWRAFRALDDEQATLRSTIEGLCEEHADIGAVPVSELRPLCRKVNP